MKPERLNWWEEEWRRQAGRRSAEHRAARKEWEFLLLLGSTVPNDASSNSRRDVTGRFSGDGSKSSTDYQPVREPHGLALLENLDLEA